MTTPVEVHIVVVHACPGFTALPAPTVRLLSETTRGSGASVSLTVEPDELFMHVDRTIALGKLFFTGGFGDAFEERFASAIAEGVLTGNSTLSRTRGARGLSRTPFCLLPSDREPCSSCRSSRSPSIPCPRRRVKTWSSVQIRHWAA